MKLIVKLSSTNPESPAAEFAFLELSAERAQKLLQLYSRVLAALIQLDRDGLASKGYSVSLGSDLAVFEGIHSPDDVTGLPDEDDSSLSQWESAEFSVLDDPAGVVAVRESDELVRLECFRADIGRGGISFAAYPRHGDQTLLSREIPLEILEQAAQSTKAEK